MILSDRTASAIGVEPGNTVIFLCSDAFGSLSRIELPLLAVFSADEYAYELSCIIDLESMQLATGAEDAAAQIASYAMDGDWIPLEPRSAAAIVRAVETKAVGLGLSSEGRDAASGTTAAMMGFMDTFMVIAYLLFAVVAVVGIMSSILLSVQDRIRDFGILRAIALTGNGVSEIIAVEALLLGTCASFLAVLAALYPMGMVRKMSIREAPGFV